MANSRSAGVRKRTPVVPCAEGMSVKEAQTSGTASRMAR
jgi:hypothetical protein